MKWWMRRVRMKSMTMFYCYHFAFTAVFGFISLAFLKMEIVLKIIFFITEFLISEIEILCLNQPYI